MAQALPTGSTTIFIGSGGCAVCHTQGGPNTSALQDISGNDVSISTYWRSTMMANSSKDPLWQAKVQAEILAHPHLQAVIEDKCTSCHAAMGNTQASYDGQPDYAISEMLNDPLAMDGVSCAVCHQIQDQNLAEGESFSGHFIIDDSREIFGPFNNPVSGPMMNMVNYTPVYGTHASESEICATCHTLFTPYVDDDGEVVGEAPEQVPYLEWLNSDFPEQGIECQTCHMPALEDNIILSNRPQWLGARNPLHTHEFVGGNVFMLKLLKEYGSELGVTANSAHFDSSIARTRRLLQNQTAELDLATDWNSTGDSLHISVDVQNLSGHKFPTAYPSRRAWLELMVENGAGETVFHSGSWDSHGEISGLDSIYESHHQLINSEDQVQIYQNITSDINGDKTYTLLRIAGYLKDNRIPPQGYLSDGAAADSTAIEGLAGVDPDFNKDGLEEGSGRDLIHYVVGGLNNAETYTVTAILNYQSIAPRFVEDLFAYDLPEVTAFQSYYEQIDNSPEQIDTAQLTLTSSATEEENTSKPESSELVTTYPNPFNPVTRILVEVTNSSFVRVNIYDVQGGHVNTLNSKQLQAGIHDFTWDASNYAGDDVAAGVYLLEVDMESNPYAKTFRVQKKLVYLK